MTYYLDPSFLGLAMLPAQGPAEQRYLYRLRGERARKIVDSALRGNTVYSSAILEVEFAHAVSRGALLAADSAKVFDGLHLVPIKQGVLDRAKSLTSELRTLDAIHLASALLLNSSEALETVHPARAGDESDALGYVDQRVECALRTEIIWIIANPDQSYSTRDYGAWRSRYCRTASRTTSDMRRP